MDRTQLIHIDTAAAFSKLDINAICLELTNCFNDANNELTTPLRQAYFLGQLAVESWHFNLLEENLNYSESTLLRLFPNHFNDKNVGLYAYKPQKIASVIYANRMGNGDVNSGDGWTYRGRGLIQITGKYLYELCGKSLNHDLVSDPDYLKTPVGAVQSAVWFYCKYHNLAPYADTFNIIHITRIINGGLTALDERRMYTDKALKVLTS